MNIFKYFLALFFASSLIMGCFKKDHPDTLFTKMDSKKTGIHFRNDIQIMDDFHILTYRNFYNGGGVGIGDINNDGLPDVYLIKNQGENKLYLNKGDFKFEDITETSGTGGSKLWSTGVTFVDINADGLLDIYVCNAGNTNKRNELFINNGDLTFTESARKYNLDEDGFTTHVAFFDYDGDGDLDAYILNNSFILPNSLGFVNKRNVRSEDWNVPSVFKGGGDKLLRNDNGYFVDVSEAAGIYGSLIGFGLGVTVGDVNNDLLPDIYVSNDFYERDYLYINQGDGTFKEEIKTYMQHVSLSSMGADMADLNNDGFPEIFVTDMRPEDDERLKSNGGFETFNLHKMMQSRDFYNQFMQNTLQINNGNGTFSETAYYSGVAETDWSWGALIFDMDNDGQKDIYVCNGIYRDITNNDFMNYFANEMGHKSDFFTNAEIEDLMQRMPSIAIPNYAFAGNPDLTFSDKTKQWGLNEPSFSNGSAYGDLDNDGDLDLIVNNVNQELFVYRNNSDIQGNHSFLKIKLKGSGSNTFGIGSKVNLYGKGKVFSQELMPTRGFQSSVDYNLVFGVGDLQQLDSLEVFWPNASTEKLFKVKVNQTITLQQSNAKTYVASRNKEPKAFMENIENDFPSHIEDPYIDYDTEGLIFKMLSKEGPAIAVGDINGDGLDDFYFGGAKNQSGKVYLQNKSGQFAPVSNSVFEKDSFFEDTDAIFTDINGDNKPDLIVVSGGNNTSNPAHYFQSRIYLNSGSGNFSKLERKLLSTRTNASKIVAYDYDNDGDIDLFIASRSIPGVYGVNPEHYLFENDGKGDFKDVTRLKLPGIMESGMITDTAWMDMDDDGLKDLVVVGDWMAPTIFKNTPEGFVVLETNLKDYRGAWNTLKIVDVNKDGKMDLILGNRGTNSFFQNSGSESVKMFVNDFDNNGTIEQIFTRKVNGSDTPIHLRTELSKQMPHLNKNNVLSSEYATKTIAGLFPEAVLDNSMVKDITTFNSGIAYNLGNNTFNFVPLPPQVQYSSVYAIETMDLNGDGILDILLAGNEFDLKPQFGRLDANYGISLLGNAHGGFSISHSKTAGFLLKGEVRSLNLYKNHKNEEFLVAGINNSKPVLFKLAIKSP